MMYIYLDEFPEHKIRTDADGNVTLSVRSAQLTVPFDEINDAEFEDADELPIDRFEKYLERAKGRVGDFLINFAGLDRGVEIKTVSKNID